METGIRQTLEEHARNSPVWMENWCIKVNVITDKESRSEINYYLHQAEKNNSKIVPMSSHLGGCLYEARHLL